MIKVGLYCVAPYDQEYHRAMVVDLLEDNPECIKVCCQIIRSDSSLFVFSLY